MSMVHGWALALELALTLVLVGVLAPWGVLKDALIAGTALARNSGDSRLVLALSIDGSVCTFVRREVQDLGIVVPALVVEHFNTL